MGNFSSNPHKIFSLDSWDLSHLPELKKNLGKRKKHIYSSNPKKIPVHHNLDLRLFSCLDSESDFLHNFLEQINEHMRTEFVKENWIEKVFPLGNESDKFTLLHQDISALKLSDTELEKIRKTLNLEKVDDNAQDEPKHEDEEDNEHQDKGDGSDINQVYRGYCIYEFADNLVGMALDMKKVGIESCFVGTLNNDLIILAPSEEPTLSSSIRFNWTLVQEGKDKIHLILDDAKGVLFEGGKEMLEVEDNYFEDLEGAFSAFESKNGRQMTHHVTKFKLLVNEIQNEGELQAYVGGEVDGEMVSFSDFLDKLKLN